MREPWEMTIDEFTGPAMVAEKFSIDGRKDEDYETLWIYAEDQDCLRPAVWGSDSYSIHEIEDYHPEGTFVLLYNGKPVGFYTDAQCWIDVAHRGKGLSTPLILAAADFHGGSPTQNEWGLGFSDAGYKAHQAAHRHAVVEAVKKGKPVPQEVASEYGLEAELTPARKP